MKNSFLAYACIERMNKLLVSFLFISMFFIASCTKSDDDPAPGSNGSQTQMVATGSWHVSLFTDSGDDETTGFSGYSFRFNPNGSVTATSGSNSKNGTWSLNEGSKKFIIDLGSKDDSNKTLGELTDDWHIISISSVEIKLSDDNTASDEFLTFSR